MLEVAEQLHLRVLARDVAIRCALNAGQMDLDASAQLRSPLEQRVHCLQQVDVRTSEDVDARLRASQQPADTGRSTLFPTELGMQVARVDNPEDVAVRPPRLVGFEVLTIPSH